MIDLTMQMFAFAFMSAMGLFLMRRRVDTFVRRLDENTRAIEEMRAIMVRHDMIAAPESERPREPDYIKTINPVYVPDESRSDLPRATARTRSKP